MNHYYFCTYFDKNYCDKGLTLYESLVSHIPSFTLYILCLDKEIYSFLMSLNLSSVVFIQLSELEERNPLFHATKENRSLIEYYFTCTPVYIRDLLKTQQEIEIISYIDADMYLFSSLDAVYDEMGSASILIVEHRFPPELHDRMRYGKFNVGYLSFRNNDEGRRCLDEWSKDCIKWCYDRVEGDQFADQKYLDQWEGKYPGLVISQNIGLNAAPWNISQYHIGIFEGKIIINHTPLVLYHFHALHIDITHKYLYCFDNQIRSYLGIKKNSQTSLYHLYIQYIIQIINTREKIMQKNDGWRIRNCIRKNGHIQKEIYKGIMISLLMEIQKIYKEKCKNDIFFILKINKKWYPVSFKRLLS